MFKNPFFATMPSFLTMALQRAMESLSVVKTPIRTGPGRKTLDTYHKKIDPKTYREAEFDDTPSDQVSRQALRQYEREAEKQDRTASFKGFRAARRHAMLERQRERELNGFYTGPAVGTLIGKENRPVVRINRRKFR